MRVTVSITFTPDLPEHRTVEAESTFEAVRAILNDAETSERFERALKKGGGCAIVISAFPAREKNHERGSLTRATGGGRLFE